MPTTHIWHHADDGIASAGTVTAIAIGPDGSLYAALYQPGTIFSRSTESEGWLSAAEQLPPLAPLSLLPTADGCLWIGTVAGLFWKCSEALRVVEGAPTAAVYDLAAGVGQQVWAATEAGLFLCTQSGCSTELTQVPCLAVDCLAGHVCTAVAGEGVFCLQDAWRRVWATDVLVNDLALSENGSLYAVAAGQLFALKQRNGSVQALTLPGGASARVVAACGRALVVGTAGAGALVTQDSGRSWKQIPFATEVTSMACSPTGPFLVGTVSGLLEAVHLQAALEHGLALVELGRKRVLAFAEANGLLFAGGPTEIFASADGGLSWQRLPAKGNGPAGVLALLAHEGSLFVGTATGIYRSDDGGGTFRLVSKELGRQTIFTLVADPHDQQKLYAGSWGNNVLLSTDGGETWAPMHSGLETLSVHSFLPSARVSGRLYAGTVEGVYCSGDGGQSWGLCSDGMRERSTVFVILEGSGSCSLYAGTTEGLYHSDDCARSWYLVPGSDQLGTVYTCVQGEDLDTLIYAGRRAAACGAGPEGAGNQLGCAVAACTRSFALSGISWPALTMAFSSPAGRRSSIRGH